MSFKVRIKEKGLPNGRVSLWALSYVVKSLQVALRAEASSISARVGKTRGRLAKLARESIGMSLVAIEKGSGVTVWKSETNSLLDIPRQVFADLALEAERPTSDHSRANIGIQKSLLVLGGIFRKDSPIEFVEYIPESGVSGKVTAATIERIALSIGEHVAEEYSEPLTEIVGRLLELNLSTRTFEIHGIQDGTSTVHFDDALQPVILGSVDRFVAANVFISDSGDKELIAMETLDEVPESRFYETTSLSQIVSEQDVSPLVDFSDLALDEPDSVSVEEFNRFLRELRSGEAS